MSKGSKQRPIQDQEAFNKNWETIFGRKPTEMEQLQNRGNDKFFSDWATDLGCGDNNLQQGESPRQDK